MDWCESVLEDLGFRRGGGLFSYALTCWLFIRQRVEGSSVEDAWLSVSPELAQAFSPDSKRAQSGVLSNFGGGYGYARQALPLAVAQTVADRLFSELAEGSSCGEISAFVLDGSSVSPDGSPELRREYPPHHIKDKESHFPCLKLLVAHDLRTGLALRPVWGPMYGPRAVSEQALARELAPRIPAGAVVVADRNFGVFSLTYDLMGLGHPCVVRLTDSRFKKILGKSIQECADQEHDVVWQASRSDIHDRPDLVGESLSGRLVVRHVLAPGSSKPVPLGIFVCGTDIDSEAAVRLYAKRWLVETDLRTLKNSLGLGRPGAKTVDVLAKEIILGFAAYNLVRAIGAAAADLAGIDARTISFSRTEACIRAYAPRLMAEKDPEKRKALEAQLLRAIAARTNKPRHRAAQPRQAWHRREKYPPKTQAHTGAYKN
jgi:hypothetical protein